MSLESETKRLSWELPEAVRQRLELCIPPRAGR
jgi:hypothetical protein